MIIKKEINLGDYKFILDGKILEPCKNYKRFNCEDCSYSCTYNGSIEIKKHNETRFINNASIIGLSNFASQKDYIDLIVDELIIKNFISW